MAKLATDVQIIDADTHYTEPYDLWTSRAPKGYEDRVLHIEEIDGKDTWVVDGHQLGFARGGGVIGRQGEKVPFVDSQTWGLDRVHQGAWDWKTRLEVMDERVAGLGLRGINMTSDPQDLGSPDLANRAWDPLWEVCQDLNLPVHFHIGSSNTAMDFFGKYFLPSQHEYVKPAIGGGMLFLNSARVVMNTIFAGIFDRFPRLKMVAVESGVGWIPFILETMDYELSENAPEQYAELSRKPSEYFKHHWYATFWFEENQGNVQGLIDSVGEDNILFETDFPHPTCLYPSPLDSVAAKMMTLRAETRRKVMGENAAKLYRL
jgi:predicted TIM-barrel fold metal-dependent hydrolase